MGGKALRKEFLNAGMLKRPWKFWLGIVAPSEICQFQKSTKLLIQKHPFSHLVCEITQEVGRYDLCFQVHVVLALLEAAEYYLTGLLEDANLCIIHAKCITVLPKDVQHTCHPWRAPLLLSSSSSPKSVSVFLSVVGFVGFLLVHRKGM